MIFKLELSPQNFHYDVLYPLYSGLHLKYIELWSLIWDLTIFSLTGHRMRKSMLCDLIANILEKATLILAGNLNSGLTYIIATAWSSEWRNAARSVQCIRILLENKWPFGTPKNTFYFLRVKPELFKSNIFVFTNNFSSHLSKYFVLKTLYYKTKH